MNQAVKSLRQLKILCNPFSTHQAVKSRIAHCANCLCDALKHVVTSTKRAALQYPAVATLQQMVDTVVRVSQAAHQLKTVIMTAGEV